jgi:uncharacterized FAD-dependent dehydrogenase
MPASWSASEPQDYRQDPGGRGPVDPLDGVAFQRHWESRAYALGGGGYRAPGQRWATSWPAASSRGFGEVEPSYSPA